MSHYDTVPLIQSYDDSVTKYMYLLFTEIPQLGKQGKRSPCSPTHPDIPDLCTTWLDNNEINTCTRLYSRLTRKSPTVNQTIPIVQIIVTSASGTGYTLSQYRSGTTIFFQHQCLTNTKTVNQQTCGPLELLTTIADCDQSFRSANLIICNHSDSTHSFT